MRERVATAPGLIDRGHAPVRRATAAPVAGNANIFNQFLDLSRGRFGQKGDTCASEKSQPHENKADPFR